MIMGLCPNIRTLLPYSHLFTTIELLQRTRKLASAPTFKRTVQCESATRAPTHNHQFSTTLDQGQGPRRGTQRPRWYSARTATLSLAFPVQRRKATRSVTPSLMCSGQGCPGGTRHKDHLVSTGHSSATRT